VTFVWHEVVIGALGALLVSWLALVAVLLVVRPSSSLLRESLRLLPDLILLLKRLAIDTSQPRRVRRRLALLMAYLAFPLDLIPDFIPVLGYADDAIIVLVVLRSTARQVGIESLRAQWLGSEDGFTVLCRAAGLVTT
jgi:uncharacterized membrane protein YkvA (DUF1232 family)